MSDSCGGFGCGRFGWLLTCFGIVSVEFLGFFHFFFVLIVSKSQSFGGLRHSTSLLHLLLLLHHHHLLLLLLFILLPLSFISPLLRLLFVVVAVGVVARQSRGPEAKRHPGAAPPLHHHQLNFSRLLVDF